MKTELQIILLATAMELLELKLISERKGDTWAVDHYNRLYNSIISELAGAKTPDNSPISEEQRNAIIDEIFSPATASYTLKSDVQVNEDGQLIYTPESE